MHCEVIDIDQEKVKLYRVHFMSSLFHKMAWETQNSPVKATDGC